MLALIRERDALRRYIEVTAGGILTLPGQQPTSKEQAQELILQFKELDRTARRDTSTLNELELSLLSLQLEQARQTVTGADLHSTLLDSPVAPNKKRIVALGLLSGLLIGCSAALIKDQRSGLIFNDDELRTSLPGTFGMPKTSGTQHMAHCLELLAQGPLNQAKSVALIPVGNPRAITWCHSKSSPNGSRPKKTGNEQRSRQNSQLRLPSAACATSKCNRSQLSQLQQSLALQGTPVAGWLMLDPTGEGM